MRGINWPAGFDPSALQCTCWFMSYPKWDTVKEINSVWSSTSLCGTPNLAARSYAVTMIYSTRAIFIDAFVSKFNCSKHDVTMVCARVKIIATIMWSRWGRHDTLLLLNALTKVLDDCIIEPAQLRVIIWWSNQKKTQKLAELYSRTFRYLCLQTLWSSQTENNNYISYFITILNTFEFQNNFIFHFSMGS